MVEGARTVRFLLFACLTFCSTLWIDKNDAIAATISVREVPRTGCNIHLHGEIVSGDAERFAEALDEHSERWARGDGGFPILCLDSPGGSFREALEIVSHLLRDRIVGAITYVPDGARCESACAIIFLAGSKDNHALNHARVIHPNAKLGFHSPSLLLRGKDFSADDIARSYSLALETVAQIIDLRKLNLFLPDSLLDGLLRTPPEDMLYLETIEQAARWNIGVFPVAFPEAASQLDWLNACENNIAMAYDAPTRDYSSIDFRNLPDEWEGPDLVLPDVNHSPSIPGSNTAYALHMGEGSECEIRFSESNREWPTFSNYGNNTTATFTFSSVQGDVATREIFHSEYMFFSGPSLIRDLPLRDATLVSSRGLSLPEHLRIGLTSASQVHAATFAQRPQFLVYSCWLTSPSARVTNVNEYVNLRRQPDFSARVIRQVPLGEQVRVLDHNTFHTGVGSQRERDACGRSCQAFGRNPNDAAARDRVQQCIDDNMLWYEITDARGNRGWVSRKFLEEVE